MSEGYKVHIYAVVRIPVQLDAIEANSHEEAINVALQKVDLNRDFRRMAAEYAEEIVSFLVDAPNDPEYELSRDFGPDGVSPLHPLLPDLQVEE